MSNATIRRSAIAALLAAAGGFAMTCSVRPRHQSYAPSPVMPLARQSRRSLGDDPLAGSDDPDQRADRNRSTPLQRT